MLLSGRMLCGGIALFVLLIVLILQYRSSWNPISGHFRWPLSSQHSSSVDDTRIHPECKVWHDWDASALSNILHEQTNASALPVVGDPAVLGSAAQCAIASSRLNHYRGEESIDGRPWREVRWGTLQADCAAGTFKTVRSALAERRLTLDYFEGPVKDHASASKEPSRTAIVLRTWPDFEWDEDRTTWLRTMIVESSLHSGGEYQVFILVDLQNNDTSVFGNGELYERKLIELVPPEFRDISYLFSEGLLESWYPEVSEHSPKLQMYQALQVFAEHFPEFDYFWQLEMDLRITNHVHKALSSAGRWARKQPRRNLWERNGRFYFPSLYNHSYSAFSAAVDDAIGDEGIWGPVAASDITPAGPQAPARKDIHWGEGEEADVITFMPMIDIVGSDWINEKEIHNFADGLNTPRRYAIVSMTRTSRRLLRLISKAQREEGKWLHGEATAETFALLHGLKGVYVPHGINFANDMGVAELEQRLHKGPPHSLAGGWDPGFSLGADGGIDLVWGAASWWYTGEAGQQLWHAYKAGACLPPMLLHPVKQG